MLTRQLPVRVSPQVDESLSSWFVRLAHANGEKVQSLAFRIWGREQRLIGLNDIDHGSDGSMLDRLASVTNLSAKVVRDTTLQAYDGWLWSDINELGARRWVCPVVDRQHRRSHFGQQACSMCLRGDREVYFRRSWRLSLHCICPQHGCLLFDRCSRCQEPLIVHRGDVGVFTPGEHAGAAWCWNCGADHRQATPVVIDSQDDADHQQFLLDVLRRGWANVDGHVVHSTLFFEGLRMLWSFLDSPRWAGELAAQQASRLPPQATKRYGSFDQSDPPHRLSLLRTARKYLDEWPTLLIEDMRSNRLSSTRLMHFSKRPAGTIPFWLWEPVHLSRDRTMYVPPDDEICEAIRIVGERDGVVRAAAVCAALNMRTTSSQRVTRLCRAASLRSTANKLSKA